MAAETTGNLDLLDVVCAWLRRAESDGAGVNDLTRAITDAGLAVPRFRETTVARMQERLTAVRRRPPPPADDDDVETPRYVTRAATPCWESTEEIAAIMAQPPGGPIRSLRLANPDEWRSDILDGRGSGGRGRPKRQ